MDIIFGKRKEDQPSSNPWEALVTECRKHPLGADFRTIQEMLDKLNTKTLETNYAFDLQQVVDGVTPPNVAPYYHDGQQWTQPIKAESVGPVIQAVLAKLPDSVRSGQDDTYEVHQVRLDDYNSWEHMMGTTTLLTVFLTCRDEADACFFFPNDPDSQTNWEVLKDMHATQFPQLGKGQ